MFAILLVVSKFLVMKAEHTVASYNGRDFKNKIATVCVGFLLWNSSKQAEKANF
jgi:hypothetical protein